MTDKEITERLEGVATHAYIDSSYSRVIRFGDGERIAGEIRDEMQTAIDKQTIQLAEQSAKIYAYEAIIANSNFKAVLPKKGEK